MNEKLIILWSFVKTRWFSFFWNKKNLRKRQRRLFTKQVSLIKRISPFYMKNSDLPIIDKSILMEQFNDINTVNIDKSQAMEFALASECTRNFNNKMEGITIGLSSGTSGHRGLFLVSDKERAFWAGTVLAKTLPKRHLFGVKIAFFMRADSALYETVNSRLVKFQFFDMQNDMEKNIRDLSVFAPTILVAPPSCLLCIAHANSTLRIHPKKIISIAEVLEHSDAETIKSAFGVHVVHQIYQCTEGFLGATCEYGILHINEDIVQMEKEMLDETRFVPIITDLKRCAQPIVRYRLNDVLIEKKERCKCGSPFLALEKIEGRCDDVFEFEGEKGTVSVFPDFIRRCLLFVDDVGEYRIQQRSTSEIAVLADDLSEEVKERIYNEFKKVSINFKFFMPHIVFLPYDYDLSRKLKRVERLC
ncbi:coenzyme F390 synthetase [Clostridia bacterium]|nr:coenzyme F390 synthetase [Clostridia bacterium]